MRRFYGDAFDDVAGAGELTGLAGRHGFECGELDMLASRERNVLRAADCLDGTLRMPVAKQRGDQVKRRKTLGHSRGEVVLGCLDHLDHSPPNTVEVALGDVERGGDS